MNKKPKHPIESKTQATSALSGATLAEGFTSPFAQEGSSPGAYDATGSLSEFLEDEQEPMHTMLGEENVVAGPSKKSRAKGGAGSEKGSVSGGAVHRPLPTAEHAFTPQYQPHTLIEDRYKLVRLLGVGGMGEVYLAKDTRLDGLVALKMLHDELADQPGVLNRFKREVKVAHRITHRNVARTFDLGLHQGQYYISMEYIEGHSLADVLRQRRKLPAPEILAVMSQLCAGLCAAHNAHIIHRDLKPDNILIARDGRVVISDFGIAGFVLGHYETDTNFGGALGTPSYMAPEQLQSQEADARADIYALGAILFEMLTGQKVWIGDGPFQVIYKRFSNPAHDLAQREHGLEPPLFDLIDACLALEPAARYSSAAEVFQQLQLCLQPTAELLPAPLPFFKNATNLNIPPIAVEEPAPSEDGDTDPYLSPSPELQSTHLEMHSLNALDSSEIPEEEPKQSDWQRTSLSLPSLDKTQALTSLPGGEADNARHTFSGQDEEVGVPTLLGEDEADGVDQRHTIFGEDDDDGEESAAATSALQGGETSISTPSLHDETSISTPALGREKTRISTPSLHDETSLTTPALGGDKTSLTTPSLHDETSVTTPALLDDMQAGTPTLLGEGDDALGTHTMAGGEGEAFAPTLFVEDDEDEDEGSSAKEQQDSGVFASELPGGDRTTARPSPLLESFQRPEDAGALEPSWQKKRSDDKGSAEESLWGATSVIPSPLRDPASSVFAEDASASPARTTTMKKASFDIPSLSALGLDPAAREPSPRDEGTPAISTLRKHTPAPSSQLKLAVLPCLHPQSPDSSTSESLTQEVIDHLSSLPRLRVRSYRAVKPFYGVSDTLSVAKTLEVDYIIESAITTKAEQVALRARLFDLEGYQIWTARFCAPEADVQGISEMVGRGVAMALNQHDPRSLNPDADANGLSLYFQARQELRQSWHGDLSQAIELFNQAMALLPDDPLVLSGAAVAYVRSVFYNSKHNAHHLSLARQLVQRAQKNPSLSSEPFYALGLLAFHQGQFKKAVEALHQALVYAPSSAENHDLLGRAVLEFGPIEDALKLLRKAVALDPSLSNARWDKMRGHALLGEWEQVKKLAQKLVHPHEQELQQVMCARLALWEPSMAELLNPRTAPPTNFTTRMHHILCAVREEQCFTPEQRGVIERFLIDINTPRLKTLIHQRLAELHAYVQEEEGMLEAIENALHAGLADLNWLRLCPLFAPWRQTPRFQIIQQRLEDRLAPVLACWQELNKSEIFV